LIGQGTPILAVAAGGVLLLLLSVGFLLWRRRKKRMATMTGQLGPGGTAKGAVAAGSDAQRDVEALLANQAAEQQRLEAEALLSLKIPAIATKKTEVLTKHLAAEVIKNPTTTAQVVRSWLNGDYKR
jgi:LPXTG-motif cell wall-anchored protein